MKLCELVEDLCCLKCTAEKKKKKLSLNPTSSVCNRGEDDWWKWKELCWHGEPYPEHSQLCKARWVLVEISREQWSGWRAAALNHHPRNTRGTLWYPHTAKNHVAVFLQRMKNNFPALPMHPCIASGFQIASYKLINIITYHLVLPSSVCYYLTLLPLNGG